MSNRRRGSGITSRLMALVALTMSPVFILFLWSSGDQRDIALETATAGILADAHATADGIESVGVELVSQASAATNRGVDLTSRLLAFSRRQPLAPKMLNLNELVLGIEGLLARTLDDAMVLEHELEEPSPVCAADANQLDSALLNLVLNARDAMPGGGRITMSTGTTNGRHSELAPGTYAHLTITDQGTGMSPEVAARAVEPFFTTKERGQGTGLGLSGAFGFAQQSGGTLVIDTTLGTGTSVHIYLPEQAPEDEPAQA